MYGYVGTEKVALNTYEHKTARGRQSEIVSGKALRDEVVWVIGVPNKPE